MFFKRKRSGEDFGEEIQAHIRMEADRLENEGMAPEDAQAAARRAFGNVTRSREEFYERGRGMWLDNLAKDIRFAFRQMKSSPVSSAAIVISLALGIGVNTAIFSLADQALLRTLPVREPDRLVQLDWNGDFVGTGMGSVGTGSLIPYLLYRDLRAENRVFEDLFASSTWDVHVTIGSRAEPAGVEIVTGSYFPALGIRAALGRLLGPEDDQKLNGHPVAVLSYDYWRNRLGSDPAIIGKQIRMNNFPMTIVGVAERGFHGMDWSMAPAMWVPVMMKTRVTPDWNGLNERRTRFLHVFGRLKPGVTRRQAQVQLQPWFKAYLRADAERAGFPRLTAGEMRVYMDSGLDLLPGARGQSILRRIIERPMEILLAGTMLILLLACLNVANLSLTRALASRRTTALRTALGASRPRIVAAQLTEHGLLASLGCAAGILLAPIVVRAMVSFLPEFSAASIALNTGLDLRILTFALGATALATVLSGTAPALFSASVQPANVLKQQSSSIAGGVALRKALVTGQFALALILLIGAGLFARTLARLRAQGPGFPTTNLLMFRLAPLSDGYTAPRSKALFRQLLPAIQSLPEVASAGLARWEMLRGGGWNNPVTVAGKRRIATPDSIAMNAVSPGFFGTLGVPIRRDRDFDERDSTDSPDWKIRSAIVNEEFVKRYLEGEDPLGVRLGIGGLPQTVTDKIIVGVVRNFHDAGLRTPEPQVYFPLWERSAEEGTFYVRSKGYSQAAVRSIAGEVHRLDHTLPVLSLRTIDDQLDRLLVTERLLATLAGGFAAVATLLSMVGLYGVLSFSAARRSKEIGIRLALGAPPRAAGGLIVREAAVVALTGTAIALPASWALGRLIESQLYGVRPMDLATVAGAAAVLCGVCLAASVGPAFRARSVDPMQALREE